MNNKLPLEYQRVEYIESTGTQYITTGISSTPSIYWKVNFSITNMKGDSGNGYNMIVGVNSNPQIAVGNNLWTVGNAGSIKPFKPKINTIYTATLNHDGLGSYFINGQNTNLKRVGNCKPQICSPSSVNTGTYAKIYNVQFLSVGDDEILYNFIPCIRKYDNKPGLYEIINNIFYTNNGTGEFLIGEILDYSENKPEVDWADSMEQTFEYYEVDPVSWKDTKPLNMVKKCKIKLDSTADTLGSATIDINDTLGECYVRAYLVIRQNGGNFRFTLGTFLVQTPSSSYDGKNRNVSMDAYTPLLELKENPPPLGFALLKNENIMRQAYLLVRDNCRAPVVETSLDKLLQDNFVADPNENWLSYITDLIGQAKYRLYLDENGKILFAPKQKLDELQPVWNYNDDNSSILYPEVNMQHDLYGIPNVVEVVCSTGTHEYIARVVNDDPNSPTSTVNRGREILHRDTEPNLPGYPTEEQIDEYARNLLEELSSVEYQVTYTHGYCPVRVGDAVRLNYKRAGLDGIKAKVISQSITCENGCSVNETAVFTKKLWN